MRRQPAIVLVLVALLTQSNATLPAHSADVSATPLANGSKDGQAYSGLITKTGEKPARLHTADQQDHTLADFDQVRFQPDTEVRAFSRLRFPFRVSWNRWESVAAMPPNITGHELRLTSPLGQHHFSADSLFEINAINDADPIWAETFDSLTHWQSENGVTVSTEKFYSAPSSVSLSAMSTALSRNVDPPLREGRFSFYFYDTGTMQPGCQWTVGLQLGDGKQPPKVLEVIGGWDQRAYKVRLPEELKEATVGVPRSTGWHQCEIELGERGLIVRIDEASMVTHRHPLSLGALREVAFRRSISGSEPQGAPELWLDDVMLTVASSFEPISFADPSQAQLLDSRGDQWLGTLTAADDKGLTFRLAGDFDQTFTWEQVQSLRMPSDITPSAEPLLWEGEIGRLNSPPASLWVELRTANADHWTVRHPLLGELSVPTSTILRYEPRVIGRRQEILSGSYHLGNKVVPDFHRPVADGTACKLKFSWPNPQGNAWVTLYVDGLEGSGAMSPYARKIKQGHLATELWLNGQKIETLNNLVALRPMQAIELKIPVAMKVLRAGENILEIRQLADPETGFHDEVEISQVAIEELDFSSGGAAAKGQP